VQIGPFRAHGWPTLVDETTAEPVLTISRPAGAVGVQSTLRFADGHIVSLRVYETVMFAVDETGTTQLLARGHWYSAPSVVLCGDATRDRLLVALFGAAILRDHLRPSGG
jgi:hypothetical protein